MTQTPGTGPETFSYAATASSPQGNLLLSIIGAAIGSAIGAAVWCGVELVTKYQLGLIAVLAGTLAGWGAVLLGKKQSAAVGLIAAILGGVGVLSGSYTSYLVQLNGQDKQKAYESFKLDPDYRKLPEEERKAAFEKVWKEEILPNRGYFQIREGIHLGWTALFGAIGMLCGFGTGAGIRNIPQFR